MGARGVWWARIGWESGGGSGGCVVFDACFDVVLWALFVCVCVCVYVCLSCLFMLGDVASWGYTEGLLTYDFDGCGGS